MQLSRTLLGSSRRCITLLTSNTVTWLRQKRTSPCEEQTTSWGGRIDLTKFMSTGDRKCDGRHRTHFWAQRDEASPSHPSLFEHCDVVTSTTAREKKNDMAEFPAHQGGPGNHQIGGLVAQLLKVRTPEFMEYSKLVVSDAMTLADAMVSKETNLPAVALPITQLDRFQGGRCAMPLLSLNRCVRRMSGP